MIEMTGKSLFCHHSSKRLLIVGFLPCACDHSSVHACLGAKGRKDELEMSAIVRDILNLKSSW